MLRSAVRAQLPQSSKYYTREVYDGLLQPLDKDSDKYTLADIEEMERIADLMEKGASRARGETWSLPLRESGSSQWWRE